MKEKEFNKYVAQGTWFHGTNLSGWRSLCQKKVQSDFNLGTELDFGAGFYLAPTFKQAESYISRILPYIEHEVDGDKEAVVIEFELNLSKVGKCFKLKSFLHFDDVFAKFVFYNRMYPSTRMHDYDCVIGVMSDSNPDSLMMEYRAGLISMDEVLQGLKQWTSMVQVSLNSQKICDILVAKRAVLLSQGKELDVDDYNKSE